MKVTANSFARHMGIAERTFHNWLKASKRAAAARPRDRVAEGIKRDPEKAAPQIAKALEDPKVSEAVAKHASAAARLGLPCGGDDGCGS